MLEVAEIIRLHGVVHCQHAGRGQKVLDYLGRYIFRVAIANSSLERIQDGQVTFRYRDNRTQHIRRVTFSGVAFLQRFLQHVGCVNLRRVSIESAFTRPTPPILPRTSRPPTPLRGASSRRAHALELKLQ